MILSLQKHSKVIHLGHWNFTSLAIEVSDSGLEGRYTFDSLL
jgi:hypothetical protein